MARKIVRGFAALDPERRSEIARQGGRAAHAHGNAHEFNSAEAAAAGRKGGRSVSRDRKHMAAIGRAGGRAARRHGAAHEWDEEEAAEAGRKGGQAHGGRVGE